VITRKQALNVEPADRAVVEELVDARLEAFVETHYPRLLRLARLICRDGVDAADAVQIGLEQAWRQRTRLRDDDRMRGWLDRIVAREAIRVAKGRRRWRDWILPQPDVGWIETAGSGGDPTQHIALKTAFGTLSAEQRAAVALHLHLGYSVADTAAIVGAPVETVRSRIRLARARLRSELSEVDR
jgi:RNA polymerase sigma-70 factor (ECF subfamily)